MKRRLAAILIGLALTMPALAVAPVSAHVNAGWAIEWGSLLNVDGETINGFVTNHLSARRTDIQVTATWKDGNTVMATVTAPAMIDTLAGHATSPFRIFKPQPVEAAWALTVAVSSSTSGGSTPVGGLSVQPGDFTTGSTYEGMITNDGSVVAHDVQVYGYRRDTVVTDAAGGDIIAAIDPGETVTYTIVFDDTRTGDVEYLVAQTTSGSYLTSWNNYFGDLGNSSDTFIEAIVWLADQGITLGCGSANFCPQSPVTRAQMAVFLDRSLDLGNTTPVGFTDIGSLSQEFKDAINALANAGITNGCATAPLRFCPSSPVTRGQMSKFIVTGFGDEGGKDIAPIAGPGPFTDDNGDFSETYNNAMADAGITNGCSATKYCPNANATREQMAVFLMRASGLPDAP